MSTTTKTWSFASDAESWVATTGPATTSLWESSDGSPANGCLEMHADGRNVSNSNYWEWTGTWEDLGVTPGNEITEVGTDPDNDYNWCCPVYNTGAASSHGPFELRDSGGTLQGTFSSAQNFSSTTSWATVNGSAISVPGAMQASSTTIKLRMNNNLATANSKTARVTARTDEIKITITHSTPAAGQPATKRFASVLPHIGPRVW